jgi:signal transduction histidine kinase
MSGFTNILRDRSSVDSLRPEAVTGREVPPPVSGFWLATAPVTRPQQQITVAVMAALFSIFVIAIIFANVPMASSSGFIPFIQAMMFLTEIITAVLLYTQFAIHRSSAILLLASAYLFTSLIIVCHTLSFPGAFSPGGLLGAGLQTAGWLHIIWHFIFPASVLGYALLKDREADSGNSMPATPIILYSAAGVFGLVILLTWGLIAADAYVPRLILDRTNFAPLAASVSYLDTLMCALAFFLLWLRQRSFLDRWLLIAIFATLLEMTMVSIISGRFTLGWYSVRLFGVAASSVVLVALLTETMILYARLADAIVLVGRERTHRLMSLDAATSAMAHELRQPVAAITFAAQAALNWLKRNPPNLEQVETCISSILASGVRTGDVISSVRDLFKKSGNHRGMIQLGDVALQTLNVLRPDLELHKVAVETKFEDGLPDIHADRTQLQQVILNLVKNAIEAMESTLGGKRLKLSTSLNGLSSVLLSVQDSGSGIKENEADRVFDPFFTTKPAGMGLGLSICQSIVEEHGGTLRLSKNSDGGCTFEIALPVGPLDQQV